MINERQNIIVWEDGAFEIRVPREPHIDAQDGGHLVIYPKNRAAYTHSLPADDRKELIALEAVCEKVLLEYLGADHVNIQRNGNWYFLKHPETKKGEAPHLHIHIYGRSRKSKRQLWGEALHFPNPKTGWLGRIHPYTDEQIKLIQDKLKEALG